MNTSSELDIWSQHETFRAPQRLVFLGASNLTRALPIVVSLARKTFAGPLSIYAAHGLGRSYGLEAGNLGKKFPGIFFSGMWSALASEKALPTAAWITDIGNDLAYEVSVERVMTWINGCVERLNQLGAQITIVNLPIEALRRVGPARFSFFRSLFFPRCRLSRAELLSRALALSGAIHEIGKSQKMPIFSARNEWYGLDPIHPLRRHLIAMWDDLLRVQFRAPDASARPRGLPSAEWRVRRLKPELWTHFAIPRRTPQPCGRFRDGSTISIY